MKKFSMGVIHWFCKARTPIGQIPMLRNFAQSQEANTVFEDDELRFNLGDKFTFFIQTYGCQMNINDSDLVRALLLPDFDEANNVEEADIVLINTCAIREKPENKVMVRIITLKQEKKIIGVLGCMAQRLKQTLFTQGVQVICGPDAYRSLPRMIHTTILSSNRSINTKLDFKENYEGITPISNKLNPSPVNASITIMRGCNNMCSFCIVPFVRGRERSRKVSDILSEIAALEVKGIKLVTFLGQNVNSYHDTQDSQQDEQFKQYSDSHKNTPGFRQLYKLRGQSGIRFAGLLELVSKTFPNIRFTFTSPHPKDFPLDLLQLIARQHNIVKWIHLPAQSGNNLMLEKMRRLHTREAYLQLVDRIRETIPEVSLSTDLICGFCGQTNEQFQQTHDLVKKVKYNMLYAYKYSMRESTHAYHKYIDDVPENQKANRVYTIIETFTKYLPELFVKEIGRMHLILIEKKNKPHRSFEFMGRTGNGKNACLPIRTLPILKGNELLLNEKREIAVGDYVAVRIIDAAPRYLICEPIAISDKLYDYYNNLQLLQSMIDRST